MVRSTVRLVASKQMKSLMLASLGYPQSTPTRKGKANEMADTVAAFVVSHGLYNSDRLLFR
jgi:hypothetical protein